ncbi:MAG: DUF2202 domain-containing protein [Thiotrichaceae bacterium]
MKLKESILAVLGVSILGSLPVLSAAAVLTTDETKTLIFKAEEEKLARDVYRTLYKKWDIRSFSNISDAEQRHMDRLSSLLMDYNLADPISNDKTGEFNNPDLAKLYAELVKKGQSSSAAALQVGAYIEEIDILDLQKAMAETQQVDLDQTYANLMRGSRNHLRAFVRQIEKQGVAYVAQAMPQEEVDMIVNSPRERGEGNGHQGGKGQGGGQGQQKGKGQKWQ